MRRQENWLLTATKVVGILTFTWMFITFCFAATNGGGLVIQ